MRRGTSQAARGEDFRGNERRSFRKHSDNYSNPKYTGAIPTLPILRVSSGHHTVESEHSFANFVSSLENYVRREYGDIADIFTTYSYPVYERPRYNERDLKPLRDPFGIRREEIKRLSIIRLEKIEKLESNKPKVYALIKGQLSLESLEKVKSLPGWNEVERDCDPIELCKRIVATHLVQAKADEEETKFDARQQFSHCKQQWNESTAEFKKRYDYRIRALSSVGEHVLDEPALARDFLGKVDINRYGELLKNYKNGLHERAKTLEEAYQLVNNYVTTKRNDSGRPIFLTTSRSISRRAYGARGHGRGTHYRAG
jgi:hypothetical protein